MRWLFALLIAPFLSLTFAASSSGNRLVVISEDAAEEKRFSKLFADLKSRGYSLSIESPKSDKLALFKHGEREYDHILLFPPKSKGYGPSLKPETLLHFINQEGNIMLAVSSESSIPSAISSLLLEFDITLPSDKNTLTIDHFNYDTVSATEKHDVLLLPRPSMARQDVKNFFGGEGLVALPHAVPQTLGNTSPLLNSILKAKNTAYSYSPKDEPETSEDPFATGEQISLVSALQARNSARFTVFGSMEALEDKWFDASVKAPSGEKVKAANRAFAEQVTKWTFKETGVLKTGRIEHYLTSLSEQDRNTSLSKLGELNPTIYRVKNDITFNIEISEYTSTHFSPPSLPSADDIQLEFTMLSPFHRLPLKPTRNTANGTIYSASFTTPDQHGIFSFRVNYKRPFFTNIGVKEEVTVRHFAHDEYPRSWLISGGWVWIAGIWVTVGGWIAFVGLWLWSAPSTPQISLKKTQ